MLLLLGSQSALASLGDEFDVSYKIRLIGGISTGYMVVSEISVLEDYGKTSLRVVGSESAQSICNYLGKEVAHIHHDDTLFAGDRYQLTLSDDEEAFSRTLANDTDEYIDYITCK